MAWTETTRAQYVRGGMRYASDCTDAEWAIVEPFMPPPSRVGRPRTTLLRDVWNAIQYIAATGCQWAMLPKDFPPFTTVQHYFYQLRDSGALDLLNEALVDAARALGGRAKEPTAAIIDSQSVKTPEAGAPRGFDAGKKIKGRKRHIVTDTQGHMLTGIVHEASIQDRDGAPRVIGFACESFPTVTHVFADSGYAGEKLEAALARLNGPVIEIVKRPDGAKGFVLVARRWVVERTLAWLNRCRRLAKDWEASIASSEAWLLIASIRQLSRRIARTPQSRC
ncbi:IS5 family transposase [Methylocystis rosea]|uniref:IS5 family transposase n=1 Tax=Methylocystis rosea TaxID=173366 RepID=A0A3G8MCA1_9HYPH|nr:IS5 family transposase [Methylocystis rosea]AZG78895.1 IS5 family transposase [Methylocystis rosea]